MLSSSRWEGSLLTELIAALPAGAAEALVSHGVVEVTQRIRARRGQDASLASDLEALSAGGTASRPLSDIATDLAGFLGSEFSVDISSNKLKQSAGDHSTLLAAGRDLIIPPQQPDQ